MQPLFSETGEKRLDEVARPGLLCAFDFDGTLAPIVPQPDDARMQEHVKDRLVQLSEYAPIAIITGRSLQDIHARLDFAPDFVVGNHGQEGMPGWEARGAEHERLCAAWKAQLSQKLNRWGDGAGIELEDKRYSLSVHYRRAQNPQEAAALVKDLLHGLEPSPRIVDGKFVYNVVPQDAYHKGSALEQLMRIVDAEAALYAGDDVTDEDVFRVKRDDLLSVRVEQAAASAAEFFLPNFCDMARFLDRLIERLRTTGAHNWVRTATARTMDSKADGKHRKASIP